MAFKPCRCQLRALSRTRRAPDWVPCGKAPIAISPLLMPLLTCYVRSCSLGFHQEIVMVLLCPPVLPTCCFSQVLTSSPGGPPCLHLCPSSHPGGMEGRDIPVQVLPLPLPPRASLPGCSPLSTLGCPPLRSIALALSSPFTRGWQLVSGVGSDIECLC